MVARCKDNMGIAQYIMTCSYVLGASKSCFHYGSKKVQNQTRLHLGVGHTKYKNHLRRNWKNYKTK